MCVSPCKCNCNCIYYILICVCVTVCVYTYIYILCSSFEHVCMLGGNEGPKDGACHESYSSPKQRPYPDLRELPPYRDPLYHDATRFYHLPPPPPPPARCV